MKRSLLSGPATFLVSISLCTLLGFACKSGNAKDKSAPGAADPKSTTATAAKAAPQDPTADIPDEAIATEEDFNTEMAEKVTATTDLSATLDALEKEIGQ